MTFIFSPAPSSIPIAVTICIRYLRDSSTCTPFNSFDLDDVSIRSLPLAAGVFGSAPEIQSKEEGTELFQIE